MERIDEKELKKLYQKNYRGDPEARNRLVSINLPLVYALARRFPADRTEFDDIVQEGCIGLIKALHKYDPWKGTKFSTYAVPYILGEIRAFLRHNGHLLKVSRSDYEHYRQLLRNIKEMEQKLGRSPRVEEIAESSGLSKEEIVSLLELQHAVLSTPENAAGSFSEQADTPFLLKQSINSLPPRERQIVILRYFLAKSQQEAARVLNISQAHVSRLERALLKKLKEQL